MSAPKKTESFDDLVVRLAYYIVQGVGLGTSAKAMAHQCAQQTLLWRLAHEKKKGGRSDDR